MTRLLLSLFALILLTLAGPSQAQGVHITPLTLGVGADYEVWSLTESGTGSQQISAGTHIFVPHAVTYSSTQGVYDSICLHNQTAGVSGTVNEISIWSSDSYHRPSVKLWEGSTGSGVGVQCATFPGGYTTAGASYEDSTTSDFLLPAGELIWTLVVPETSHSLGTVAAPRHLAPNESLVGAPLTSFTISYINLSSPIVPAYLGRWTGRVPVVGFTPNR